MERAQAVDNFQALNRIRVERLSELFPVKNRSFLELLPLLFHTNSTILPGYIGEETPAGIVDYQPSNSAIDAAKKIEHTFQYKHRSLHKYPIQGIYFVNENGILNVQSDTPFELWLVYTHPLADELVEQLQQKLTTICEWAKSLGIELKAQLLNSDALSDSLDTVKLDRFYHSGIVLAGCLPSWWYSTPDEDIAQTSLSIADIQQSARHSVLDFGSITSIDAQTMFDITAQYFNAAMDKGLDAGLTLVYLNHQLEQYPALPWLSQAVKQAIYNEITDPLSLDPNTLKLQVVSTANYDANIISLAQQSFYVLCEERLSKTVNQSRYPWRRDFIEQQLDSWQWPAEMNKRLDQRFQSQYRQKLDEFEQIHEQISVLMQSLFEFAKHHKLHVQTQRNVIEKKLKILFETLPDTIQRLPNQFLPILSEESLYLYRRSIDDGWHINDTAVDTTKQSALYQHTSLINVLAWAINNQLLTNSTNLKVADHTHKITLSLILELVQQLISPPLGVIADRHENIPHANEAEIQQVRLFINFEHQPVSKLSQQGLKLSTLQSDPLNYSNSKQTLVAKIESLIYSNQGHWHYFVHSGITSPLQMLSTLLRWSSEEEIISHASCWCPSEYYGKDICNRISTLYTEVSTHYNNSITGGEYLVSIDNQLYKLLWQEDSCDYIPLSKNKSLFQHLAQARSNFATTKIDASLDSNGLLDVLFARQVENEISIFLYKQNQYTAVYILNEFGSLYRQHVTGLTETTLVSHFQSFFDPININSIQFFRLGHQDSTAWTISAISLNSSLKKEGYLPVTIEMASPDDNASCTIHCGPKVFKGLANDHYLFKQVGELVLGLRKASNKYPLYITRLSFEQHGSYTSHQYIIQKQRLEYLLNKM